MRDRNLKRTDQRNSTSINLFSKLGFDSLGIYDPEKRKRIYLSRPLGGENED